MNRVMFVGRLCSDFDYSRTFEGHHCVEGRVAVPRSSCGPDEDCADFFRIRVLGLIAAELANTVHRGQVLMVDGRIETEPIIDSRGKRGEVFIVRVDRIMGVSNAIDVAAEEAAPAQPIEEPGRRRKRRAA